MAHEMVEAGSRLAEAAVMRARMVVCGPTASPHPSVWIAGARGARLKPRRVHAACVPHDLMRSIVDHQSTKGGMDAKKVSLTFLVVH